MDEIRKFSVSRIDSFINCPQLYKLRYIDRLSPKKKKPSLSAGYLMSCGVEAFRKTGSSDAAGKAFMEAFNPEVDKLEMTKDKDPLRSIQRLLEILLNYCDYYPDEPNAVIKPEIRFELPLDPSLPNVKMRGKLDAIERFDDGSPVVFEDKTTTRLGDTFFAGHKESLQVCTYLWAANTLGLFEIDKKTSPKCVINAIYIHAEKSRLERDFTIKNPLVLENTRLNLVSWIKKIFEAEKSGEFPHNYGWCKQYGGCDFRDLRNAYRGSLYDKLIASNFVVREPFEDSDEVVTAAE